MSWYTKFTRLDFILVAITLLFVAVDYHNRFNIDTDTAINSSGNQVQAKNSIDKALGQLSTTQQQRLVEYFGAYDVVKNKQKQEHLTGKGENSAQDSIDELPWRDKATRINGADFRLIAVFIQQRQQMAMVMYYSQEDESGSGAQKKQVSVGDTLGGLKVTRIEPTALLLKSKDDDEKEYIVPLFPRNDG